MNQPEPSAIGELIREARIRKNLSTHELARLADIQQSTIVRIEQGHIAAPKPTALDALARSLDLNLADVYAAARYPQPDGLPSFAPYLRTRYGGLPPEAQRELERSFAAVVDKYGYDPHDPGPSEDEF